MQEKKQRLVQQEQEEEESAAVAFDKLIAAEVDGKKPAYGSGADSLDKAMTEEDLASENSEGSSP